MRHKELFQALGRTNAVIRSSPAGVFKGSTFGEGSRPIGDLFGCTLSNHAGGILGGISTGQDIVTRFAVKPTSSILSPRKTVDVSENNTEIVTKGRHDPCVGIRAVPVGEAMVACVLADHALRHRAQMGG